MTHPDATTHGPNPNPGEGGGRPEEGAPGSPDDHRKRNIPVATDRRRAQNATERRKNNEHRRLIDPTSCERDYNEDEIEFMKAMDRYKRENRRPFPTWSEVFEVLRLLGYRCVAVRTSLPGGKRKASTSQTPTSVSTPRRVSQSWTESLIETLIHEKDQELRALALSRLDWSGGEKSDIFAIVLGINDSSEEVREIALNMLRTRFSLSEWVPNRVETALKDQDADVRLQAIRELVTLSPAIREARESHLPGWREVERLIQHGQEGPMAVDRFEEEYPEELSDRLQWLESRLGANHGRLLQLPGLSREEALASNGGWQEIAAQVGPHAAQRIEHLLTHYLSYFGYDTEQASQFSRSFPDRIVSGEIDLEEYIPDYHETSSPTKREEALITAIFEEGPGLLPALAVFLFSGSLPNRPVVTSPTLETVMH